MYSFWQYPGYLWLILSGVLGGFMGSIIHGLVDKIAQSVQRLENNQCQSPHQVCRLLIMIGLSAVLTVTATHQGSLSWAMAANLLLMWGLLLLAGIDNQYFLLPDCLTLPLLWLGLLCNSFAMFVPPGSAIWGAITGYMSFWLIAAVFKSIRGVDGLGQGDMKLLAVFGAWWGMTPLAYIVLIAAILGVIMSIISLWCKRNSFDQPLPFGTYLVAAALLTMFLLEP